MGQPNRSTAPLRASSAGFSSRHTPGSTATQQPASLNRDTGSEQWRRECEARHVLSLPFAMRKPYLELIGKVRGRAAQEELQDEVKRQYCLNTPQGARNATEPISRAATGANNGRPQGLRNPAGRGQRGLLARRHSP
ncbi:DUF7696 family protein [Achromobacter insolitus]